ncbi:MAG: hypothetical protein IJ161_12375, partial [Bacteroidales bacterium]|nr:hypothetical protein [Bacteroidales bacterium]
DHLGSVRVVKDGSGDVRQRFDYYPFGKVSRAWTDGTDVDYVHRWRFGGKEIAGQKMGASVPAGIAAAAAGSPYLDFGARLYDPRTAAWLSQDPLSEKYYLISPYAYCAGNPVNLVDPDGNDWFVSDDYQFRWFNSSSKEYWEDDIRYSWVGESLSFQQEDGSFLNFYQNYQIGDATQTPQNAERLVLSSPALTGYLLGRDSNLPDYAKSNLMMAIIHEGQNDFLSHPITQRTIGSLSFILGSADLIEVFAQNIIGKAGLSFESLLRIGVREIGDKKHVRRVYGRSIKKDIKELAKTYGANLEKEGGRRFFYYNEQEVSTHLSTSMNVPTLSIPKKGSSGFYKIRYMK